MLTDYPEMELPKNQGEPERVVDEEISRPITSVQVDGLVLLKILQHAKEYLPELVSGHCMGMGSGNTLEVTHCFPLIARNEAEDMNDATADIDNDYQRRLQDKLRMVNIDCLIIGWYAVAWQESYFNSTFIDTMNLYQSELGEHSICLLFDPLRSLHGKLYVKALRLKPEFMKMLEENSDKKDFSQSIIDSYGVTSMDIFQEVPITVHNPHLVDEFLWELGNSKEYSSGTTTEENIIATDKALSSYQTISATTMVETADQTLAELTKYNQLIRRKNQPDTDDRQFGKPSRLETLYLTAQLSNLTKHMCDVSHIAFESVSLCDALQQAQHATN